MLASLLLKEPVGLYAGKRPRTNVPDKVLVQGVNAIREYIAEQVVVDGQREIAQVLKSGRRIPKFRVAPLTVVEAIEEINAEAIEFDNEVAIIMILATLD